MFVNIGFLTYNDNSVFEKTGNLFDKLSEYTAITVPNKKEYSEIHGYKFYNFNSMEENFPAEWSKVVYCLKVLKDHDWVYWLDADAMITNFKIKLESIIDDNYDVIVSKDSGGMNTGSFLIKNSKWSYDFLNELYQTRIRFERGEVKWHSPHFTDQDAMIYLLNNNWNDSQKHFKFIDKKIFNSYSETSTYNDWQIGDFVLHMPATMWRKEKFERYLPYIVR